jgi:hypothetical protein
MVRLPPKHLTDCDGHTWGMSILRKPLERTLVTPSCVFKLYGTPLSRRIERNLRGVALTWISDTTAGFTCVEQGDSSLSVCWWEEQALRRLRCDLCAPGQRPKPGALTVASVDELPILAFEAASWNRNVLRGRPPSIPSYLSEFHP